MESTSCVETIKTEQLYSSTEENTDETDMYNLLREITLKCKEEMEKNCLHKPLEDYMERVAHYSGLQRDFINQTIGKDLNEIDYKEKYFELTDRVDIFKHMAEVYFNKEFPTFKSIFTCYKTKYNISFLQFQYMMNCIGFEYHKTELGKDMLIEDPSLTFERYLYLKKIANLRSECAPVYYIDERFFDATCTFPKPWIKGINVSSPACDGYVFFHAISKQGFLKGLFCSPATKTDFVKWISHVLIPLLPKPSVIVMDNNNLHGSLVNTITKYHSKKDMLQYLNKKNIPCNECMHKAELYELITKCSTTHNICYDVDEIFRAHGHHVLRLPVNFHDLSLTHFLWKHVLELEKDLFLNTKWSEIKVTMLDRLSRLPRILWENFHTELLKTEEDILKIDFRAYEALEKNYKISS